MNIRHTISAGGCWETPNDAHCPETAGRTLGPGVAKPKRLGRPARSSVGMVRRNS